MTKLTMKFLKPRHGTWLALALMTVGVLLAGTAFAGFGRNISGSWTTSKGATVVVIHNTSTGKVSLTFPLNLPGIGANRLTFRGDVLGVKATDDEFGGGSGAGANDFMLSAELEPISFGSKATCTLEGELNGYGTVLGQAPSRKLRMLPCKMELRVSCDDGTRKTLDGGGCSGDWQ